jgi:hypothetical protein
MNHTQIAPVLEISCMIHYFDCEKLRTFYQFQLDEKQIAYHVYS